MIHQKNGHVLKKKGCGGAEVEGGSNGGKVRHPDRKNYKVNLGGEELGDKYLLAKLVEE